MRGEGVPATVGSSAATSARPASSCPLWTAASARSPIAQQLFIEQRRALGWRQVIGAAEDRPQELVQAGEGQVRLGLHAGRAQDGHPAGLRARGGLREQRGLADPGLAADHQRATAVRHALDELGDQGELAVTAEEPVAGCYGAPTDAP